MTKQMNISADKYQKMHRRKSIWLRVISVLSAVTVFITTYAMILPAITMEPSPGIKLENEFGYEDENVEMIFTVTGRAVFQNESEAVNNATSDKVMLAVTQLSEDSEAHTKYAQYAEETIGADDLYQLLTMELTFTYEGAVLDMSNCAIDVEILAKDELLSTAEPAPEPQPISTFGLRTMALRSTAYSTAGISTMAANTTPVESDEENDSLEPVTALTAFQGVNTDLAQQSTSYQAQEGDPLSVSTPVYGTTMALALYSTVNPTFTVQYYSYHNVLASSGDKAVDEIDTSGGKLPVNGGPNSMKDIWLNAVGSGKYVLATQQKLDILQKQVDNYEYVKAPGVAYVDRLRDNGNYALDEVWVLKSGKNQTSTTRSDWTIYPATVGFTNRESSAGSNRIYITDDTVIRLVYRETAGSYTNAVDFYDYDISSGKHTVSNGVTTAYTSNYGINRYTAASGTVKYAFGNVNTQTDFGTLSWTNNGQSNTLNQYNRNNAAYDGCTFGLVTGINADGTMVFAKGVSAPVLFGKANGTGKTYHSGYNLQFERSGDTYTLVAVRNPSNKAIVQNLDQFNNPSPYSGKVYTNIFTNNFWPMDYANTWGASGHDPKFGNYANATSGKVLAQGSSATSAFPESDDGLDHNSYFGMQYSLTFELTEDYAGPLDYVFYGDDDMWVFLDGQLVCDIGGVHSSVGQYVNLRDYINKMPDTQKYGKHTLYFCYTERGASGSTCYMRFTLPSVSIDTPQVESNTLELGKQVNNSNTDREFRFTIDFTDENGNELLDDYSYTRYAVNGEVLEMGILNSSSNVVLLRGGEKIQVDYLPDGTKFSITEEAAAGYSTVYSVNGAANVESNTVSGSILDDVHVLFINSTGALLPSTGGSGIWLYTIPLLLGLAMLPAIPIMDAIQRRRKRLAASAKQLE